MKNVFLLLICFTFAGVALQAQTDTSIPSDAIGTYELYGTDATAVVSSTGIVATTGSNSVSDGSGGAATSGSGTSDTSPDDGLSNSAVGLHDVRKTKSGWGGIYTTEDGKDIPVMLELVVDAKGRRGILVKDRSGAVVARYMRG
ncbi:MAG: hypothetical protein K9I85_13180 [Saprospiraceae bacterium]|nr:hypothetical protein [Saprospiraceae bacterium]